MKTAHDLVCAARARIREVELEAAPAMLTDADVVIDVREADEYAAGHVAGAINIPRGLLEFRLSSTPGLESRALCIVVYCKTSGRAALSAATMADMGYLNVHSIAGGFDAWAAAGKPVVKPALPDFE